MSKHKTNYWKYLSVFFLLVAIVAIVALVINFDKVKNYYYVNYGGGLSVINSNTPLPSNPSYQIKLEINPNSMCIGDTTTGYIDSNMPYSSCMILYKTAMYVPWTNLLSVTLDAQGSYQVTRQINTAGTSYYKAVCRASNNNWIESNTATLIVNNCGGNDGGGSPMIMKDDVPDDDFSDDVAPDDDDMNLPCSSTAIPVSSQAMCTGRYGCPPTYDCYYKPAVMNNPAYCNCEPISEHTNPCTCQDSDAGNIYNKGYVIRQDSCGWQYDYCYSKNVVVEYICSPGGTYMSSQVNCPTGNFCMDGACASYSAVCLQYCNLHNYASGYYLMGAACHNNEHYYSDYGCCCYTLQQ